MSDSIFAYIEKQENLKTLRSLLPMFVDLKAKLSSPGEYTFFVPSDEAFMELPSGSKENLHNDTDLLQDTLLFHVVLGKHNSAELKKLAEENKSIMAEDHNPLSFVKEKDLLWAGSGKKKGKVVTSDIELSNGIIHVVDQVFGFNVLAKANE